MKKQVFFIHGGDSFSRQEDFLQHLQSVPLRNLPGSGSQDIFTKTLPIDLGDDVEVFMPSMPNKQNAKFEEWSLWFERHFEYLSDGVVLVGWSLGGLFLAKYLALNKLPFTVSAVHLMAAPYGGTDDADGNDCGSFRFETDLLPGLLVAHEIHLWHSTDDFVVPYSHALKYQEMLKNAVFHTFTDRNHFLIEHFPELIMQIKANFAVVR